MIPRPLAPALLALALACGTAWAASLSPVGTWRTFDEDGTETGSITIGSQGGVLVGSVASVADPAKRGAVCRACTDERKGQKVVGLQVIRDMRQDGDEWDGGNILDPRTGKIYRLKMHLTDGGSRLVLRGYIGISLFGRSQTWLREQAP